MEMIPETNRLQSEALKAIHIQLQGQNAQQERLATILESMGRGSGEQRKMLEQIAERVDAARDTDERISDNLNNVSTAMQTVVRSSQSSAEVMQQMREDTKQRDAQLEEILHKQNVRFTTMLSIAIFLSIAAVVAVTWIGYMMVVKR